LIVSSGISTDEQTRLQSAWLELRTGKRETIYWGKIWMVPRPPCLHPTPRYAGSPNRLWQAKSDRVPVAWRSNFVRS